MLDISKHIDQLLEEQLLIIVEELKAKHIELGQKATGKWVESLEVVVSGGKGVIYGTDYTQYIVKGAEPNKIKDPRELSKWAYGMANSNPDFKAWLEARNVTQYGVQIAYTIGKNGTETWQKGGSDLIDSVITQQRINKMYSDLGERVSVIIANNLRR